MPLKSKMSVQVWILTLAAFAIGTAEFVIAGILPEVASSLRVIKYGKDAPELAAPQTSRPSMSQMRLAG